MGCCGITHDLSSDLINIPLNYNIKILEEIPPNSNNNGIKNPQMNIATILSPFQSKNMYQIYNIDVII
jgi:hypothetical protein